MKGARQDEQETEGKHNVALRGGGQQPHVEEGAAQDSGLRGELRRHTLLAHGARPLRGRHALLRGDAALAGHAEARQEVGADELHQRERGPRHDSLRRCRLRLPAAGRHADVGKDTGQPLRVPHIRIRDRELPVLRAGASQRLRDGDAQRPCHIRLRGLSAPVLGGLLPAVRVVGVDVPHGQLRRLFAHGLLQGD